MIVLVELVPRSWAPASGLIGPPTAGLALIAVILSLPGPRRLSAAGRRLALVGAVLGCAILLAFTVSLSLRFTRRGDLIMPAIRYVFYTAEKVEAFKSDCGRYPTTAEGLGALVIAPANVTGWKGPYRTSIAPDSWGHAFIYVCPGTHNPTSFDLYSAGPDGKPGTADDIGNWKRP
jgi:general secretion pathway protein G